MSGNGTFMKIGWRYILPVWGVTFLVLVFSDAVLLNLFLIVVSFLVAYLFYVPERTAPETSSEALLSPIDGKVLSVERGDAESVIVLKKSLFDGSSAVRAPVGGELLERNIVHGLFLGSQTPLAARLNEHGSFVFTFKERRAEVAVRCGFYALGLPILAERGRVEAGEVVAHLSEGTVELRLPATVRIDVNPGDRVVGGYSLLAYGNS